MEKSGRIVRASAEEVQAMLDRGESRTDWKRVRAMSQEEVERLADEEDGPLPEGWESTVVIGTLGASRACTFASTPTCSTGSRRAAPAIRPASMRCCAPSYRRDNARNMARAKPSRPVSYRQKHLLAIEGLTRRDRAFARPRGELRPAQPLRQDAARPAARAHADQPVLRGLHPHPHQLRAGRQAARRRRDQHVGLHLLGEQGRDAARHRRRR